MKFRAVTGSSVRRSRIAALLGVTTLATAFSVVGISSASASPTVGDGASSGAATTCTWTYNWHYSHPLVGGYTEVEWAKNPCGLKIEDKTVCQPVTGGVSITQYSGIVKAIGLWDKAPCGDTQVTESGWERHTNSDGSWSAWHEYWSA